MRFLKTSFLFSSKARKQAFLQEARFLFSSKARKQAFLPKARFLFSSKARKQAFLPKARFLFSSKARKQGSQRGSYSINFPFKPNGAASIIFTSTNLPIKLDAGCWMLDAGFWMLGSSISIFTVL